jgi:prevent-host-death family protein
VPCSALYRILYNEVDLKTLPLTDARKDFPNIVDEVSSRHEHVVITKRGKPAAVVMSVDEFESWQETLEIMADRGAMAAIARAERDIKAGRVRALEEVIARKRRRSA